MNSNKPPAANEPFVQASEPNQDVAIFAGSLKGKGTNGEIEGEGRLFFRWLPTPSLNFEIAQLGSFVGNDFAEITIDVSAIGLVAIRAGVHSSYWDPNLGATQIAGRVLDDFSLQGDGIDLMEVSFDISNFHNYVGDIVAREGGVSRSRLTLQSDDWFIDIDATADIDKRIKSLKTVGGLVVTYSGVIRKMSGKSFSFADTYAIRIALSKWLSFSRGLWCSPIFWHSKLTRWTHYTCPRLSSWRGVQSWFPLLYCNEVPNTFHRIVQLLADPIWKDPFELAIYWYIHANECAGGIEGSLVLIQTAFEMLAWTYLIEDKQILTESA